MKLRLRDAKDLVHGLPVLQGRARTEIQIGWTRIPVHWQNVGTFLVTAVSGHKQFLKVLIKMLVDIYSYFQIKYKSSLNRKIKLFEGKVEPPSLIVNHLKLSKLKRNRFSTYQHVIQYYFILLKTKLSGLPKEFHTYRFTFSNNTENHYQPRPAVKQREEERGKTERPLFSRKGLKATLLENTILLNPSAL